MFDESSGQVFREWTVPSQNLNDRGGDRDWSRPRQYSLFNPKGTKGPRSLIDMTIHVVADNIGDISEEHLDAIPDRLLWRLWRFFEARGVCLHAWKLFSKVLTTVDEDKPLGLYRFRHHICRPTDELKVYVEPLVSLTTDFLSHLVISGGCQFSTSELLCLTDLRNLGALEIIQPADEPRTQFLEVNDRLLRGWTEADDPFPLLRILRIWVDRDITQNSLRWATKFPSLSLYDVAAARRDWEDPHAFALEHGWEKARSSTGIEDSLLRYLMLLAPAEQIHSNCLRDQAERWDANLMSLCSDSRCSIKHVANRQAPPLLDYLTDTARAFVPSWHINTAIRDAGSCHGIPFEAWAFWLYSFIGQISGDQDLHSRGFETNMQAVAGPLVLPSKPMASLFLGHNGRGGGITNTLSHVGRRLFSVNSALSMEQMTFTRPGIADEKSSHGPVSPPAATKKKASHASSDQQESSLRSKKRQRLEDILQSFTQ
ncbi:hypothetical protein EsDP_00002985 [Epichloe bromicola]|uniref:Uncharacterized protein n=1 Tax=Epichloe bromicola TaxID=79588 RepID=A0ABQ0CMG5_9HYPO